jgi:hypothetical protein
MKCPIDDGTINGRVSFRGTAELGRRGRQAAAAAVLFKSGEPVLLHAMRFANPVIADGYKILFAPRVIAARSGGHPDLRGWR